MWDRSRNPLVTLCMLDRSRRDAHFDIACATLPSLCACCIVSLWCGAHFDIFLATLPSLCACWIALVVGRFALFYTGAATQSLLHTESLYTQDFFARPRFYTKMFTHRSFYTQKLWRIDAFGRFCIQVLLQILYARALLLYKKVFRHLYFYAKTLTHRGLYRRIHAEAIHAEALHRKCSLHTGTFTRESFYTHGQLLQSDIYFYTHNFCILLRSFAHRCSCKRKLSRWGAFTCSRRSF